MSEANKAAAAIPNGLTPMLRQYYELKVQHPDAILFFRMGDFYEIFAEDALEVGPLLQLTMTSRERGDQTKVPFCGVPHHSARVYWLRLLRLGFKVAIADQVENPAEAKGLVRREVVRVISPGSLDDLDGLEGQEPNFIVALHEDPETRRWAVAVAEVSTGELRCGAAQDLNEACQQAWRFRPREVLIRRFYQEALAAQIRAVPELGKVMSTPLPEAILRAAAEQVTLLAEVLGTADLAAQPSGFVPGAQACLAGLLSYLHSLKAATNQFTRVGPLVEIDRMILDETAIRDLEIFETARRREAKGSFMASINHTLSPMGARQLRRELSAPLRQHEAIIERQEAVAQLVQSSSEHYEALRMACKGMTDLERLCTRVVNYTVTPAELLKILGALTQARELLRHLQTVVTKNDSCLGLIISALKGLGEPWRLLTSAVDEGSGLIAGTLDFFREGYAADFDRLRHLALNGEAGIQAYESKLKQETGITSLKIKDHKSLGYLIEVTKTNLSRVPATFIRRQSMVNCERFITIHLQELEGEQRTAQIDAEDLERQYFHKLISQLSAHRDLIRAGAQAIAMLDLLQSLAYLGRHSQYVRPELSKHGELKLEQSRHPVVEVLLGRANFTPNDILMNRESSHLLITGPNMAGKSTVMRQTALAAILTQIGGWVPAKAALLPVFDRVFTRVGASDDMARGQSTFMVEMSEAAHILRHATRDSLILLDEIGRGTSTEDGLAIASAILEELALKVRGYALFATHFHEIVPFAATLPGVRAVQTEVVQGAQGIRFRHRLIGGAASCSFGLEVAKLAGLPKRVVDRAQELLPSMHGEHARAPSRSATRARPLELMGFEPTLAPPVDEGLQKMAKQLSAIDVNETTPLQAMQLIADLKAKLAKSSWWAGRASN